MGKVIQFPRRQIMCQVGIPSPVARGYLFGLIPCLMFWLGTFLLWRAFH